MTTPLESKIRDALAQNLEVLEPGLELVEKEYKLPNPLGGKGFVDILARDGFRVLVVVELKRSDSAARQALHEMFKYTALLRQNHGIGDDAIRCAIVSTDWHELRVPFAELKENSPFHVDGYELEVDAEGAPTSAKRVTPVRLAGALEMCPSGFMFLFDGPEGRELQRPEIERAAKHVGVEDYLLIEQDYEGDNPMVVYPHGYGFMIATLDPAQREEAARRSGLSEEELEEIVAGNPWYLEETVLGGLSAEMKREASMDIETLYPDKFRAHEENWPVRAVHRHGERIGSPLRSDDDLLSMVRGNEGGVSSKYERVASPRIGPVWQRVRDDVRQCLTGNEEWQALVNAYLDQREEAGASGVAISIFNPGDLVMALFKLGAEGTLAYLPALQLVSEPDPPDAVDAAIGLVEWDRETTHEDPQELLDEFFEGEMMNYFIRRTVGETWELDDQLLSWHGLACVLYGLKFRDEEEPETFRLRLQDGILVAEGVSDPGAGPRSMVEFTLIHSRYLAELAAMVRAQSIGL
jgi:hypothetical protein